jgi:hypothetical protein
MTDYKFLALEGNNEELRIGKDRVITQFGETQLYRATNKDYIAQRMYACDDGMYVGEIDFLLGNV